MAKQRVNLCVNDKIWSQFKELAQRRRVSASVAVEEAMARALADEEATRQRGIAAIEALLALDLGPVGTPEELCAELDQAHLPCGWEEMPI